jgi:hypothetical protein
VAIQRIIELLNTWEIIFGFYLGFFRDTRRLEEGKDGRN